MTFNFKHLILLALFSSAQVFANQVDLGKSSVTWTGTKVIGSSHTGEVKIQSADLKYNRGEAPLSGKVVIDMTSITNTDLKDKEFNDKLVGHLKSDDFFSVEKYKSAELVIDKISKASEQFYLLSGKLTIKGKTQPVKLKAEVKSETAQTQIIEVDFDFDRTKYGIKYGSGSFFTDLGDKMISDDVKITVKLVINKKK